MSVYRRGRVWWYRFAWRGEVIRRSTKQSNKRTAEQMEAACRTALAKGEVGIVDNLDIPTLSQFAPRFMEAIQTQCASKPNTIDFYRRKLANLLSQDMMASRRLDEIDERLIDAYKRDRSRFITRHKKLLSPASINRELATLRRLLRLAQEWRVINRVPRIRLLRGERIREYVVSSEHERLYFGMATGDLHDVAALLLETGLRVSEALTLEWTNVRLQPGPGTRYGHLTIRAKNSKNSKSRNVPLTARAIETLKSRGVKKTGLVFLREDSQPLVLTRLDQQHRRLRKLLKLPKDFVLHSFRHTFGTRLGEAGADAFTIMRLMGHSTVVVSQRYVHPTPETLQTAIGRVERLYGGTIEVERDGVGTISGTPAPEASLTNRPN